MLHRLGDIVYFFKGVTLCRVLLMDVVSLSSQARFPPTFLKHCGRGEGLGSTICLKAVVGLSKGMLPVKHFRSNKASSYQLNFMEIIRLSYS